MWYVLIAVGGACLIAFVAFQLGRDVENARWTRSLIPFSRDREE